MKRVSSDILNDPNVKSYDGKYYASKLGIIYTTRGSNVYELKATKHRRTVVVKMYNNTKSVSVIVWETFNGKIPKGYTIAHKNGMSTNCELHNLELITFSEWSKRLREGQKRNFPYVRDLDTGITYKDTQACGRATNYTRDYVAHVCNGRDLPNKNKFIYVPRRGDYGNEEPPLYAYIKDDYLMGYGTKEELCNKFDMTSERFKLLRRKDRRPVNEQMMSISRV